MGKRYISLIPAYEPDEKLIDLLEELKEKGFENVVVDDGSGGDYKELFNEAGKWATILTHENNRGKGAAIKTGLEYIGKYLSYSESKITNLGTVTISVEDAVVVTVDADGQHLPEDVHRVAEIASKRRDALVLGSRAFKGDIPVRSMMGNSITRYVYSMVTGASVKDTQTGLRAFSIKMIPRLLKIDGDRYEYEINMLMAVAAERIPIIEEEIETVYIDNNRGSHFSTIRDSFRIYKEILKFSASSIVSFIVDYLMYALLTFITGSIGVAHSLIISNVGARIVSASVNYNINRHLVFSSRNSFIKSATQYFALAVLILIANTLILTTLAGLGMNKMIAKLIVECLMFAISWTVQRYLIFYNEESETEKSSDRGMLVRAEGR